MPSKWPMRNRQRRATKIRKKEDILREQISAYLQWKGYDFRFDLAADIRLTMGQAVRNKRINGPRRGHPDLTVYLNGGHAVFFELKKDPSEVYKKDGSHKKKEHLQEQLDYHQRLRNRGFEVFFVFSLEDFFVKLDSCRGHQPSPIPVPRHEDDLERGKK